jgi:chemotaxis signal transduction protein
VPEPVDHADLPELTAPLNQVRLGQARYGFVVGELHLTAAAGVMTELLAQATVFPIPKSAPAMVGVINHRGSTVPVFDPGHHTSARAGVQPALRNVLIFGEGEHRAGMVLNTTPDLLELYPAEVGQTRPDTHLSAYLDQPWVTGLSGRTIWWEFNYRAAFLALAQGAASVNQQTKQATTHLSALHADNTH